MADSKVTALTADTAVDSADLGYTIEDPGGTPISKKATWLNILKGAALGVLTSDNDIFARISGVLTRLPVGASSFVGRKASGDISAMSVAEAQTLLGVPCKIAEVSLGGTSTSIDFSSIPSTFKHLHLIGHLRDDRGAGATEDSVKVAFNNDTTDANYDRRIDVSSAAFIANDRNLAGATAASATADQFAQVDIWIANYAGANRKTALTTMLLPQTADTTMPIVMRGVLWQSTTAINRVTFTPNTGTNFVAGSIMSLYGWP